MDVLKICCTMSRPSPLADTAAACACSLALEMAYAKQPRLNDAAGCRRCRGCWRRETIDLGAVLSHLRYLLQLKHQPFSLFPFYCRLQEVLGVLEARAKMDAERASRNSMASVNTRNKAHYLLAASEIAYPRDF